MTITVLAPALNEELVIERFVRTVLPVLSPTDELLVVDDGSTDDTPLILERLAREDVRLRVVTHDRNEGLGVGLQTGFREAKGDVIVTMDADLSHPLDLLPVLVAALDSEAASAAYGSRFVRGGGMEGVPLYRRAISKVANLVLRVVFMTRVRDLTTGYRAYRKEDVVDLNLTGTGFETQLELSVRLVTRGRKIVEVPLLLHQRVAGESKMRYLRLMRRYGSMVLRLLRTRWALRSSRP